MGAPINILIGTPTTFPARTPFTSNTLGLDANMDAVGKFGFALEVDGTTYRVEISS